MLALLTTALATPYVLDQELTGVPSHTYRGSPPLPSSVLFESWQVAVPGPTAGTSSIDVRFTLPITYDVANIPPSTTLLYKFECEWGGSSTTAGQRFLTLDASHVTFVARAAPAGRVVGVQCLGAARRHRDPEGGGYPGWRRDHGVRALPVRVRRDRAHPTRPRLHHARLRGHGDLRVELALRIDTGSFPNQDLFVEPVYLTDVAARLADDASAAYSTRFGAASTPDAAAVEDDLQPLVGALLVGGCTVTDSVRNGISGAYDKTELTGTDDDGAVSGTQHLGTRTFGATLGRGTLVGSEGSLFSAQTSGRKLFAETDDGGFFAGRWKRVKGARGVFYGVSGVCHGASDAPTALAGWFDGPLP